MAADDLKKIEKYKEAIKPSDRAGDAEYERRLSLCKGCDRLNAGTCNACGCYVELRAFMKESECPYKIW